MAAMMARQIAIVRSIMLRGVHLSDGCGIGVVMSGFDFQIECPSLHVRRKDEEQQHGNLAEEATHRADFT